METDSMPTTDVVSANERELPTLPDVDTSRQARAFVLAAFLEELLLWGPLSSTGIFLKHYATLPMFASSSVTKISLIGTLSLFLAYAAGMPLLYLYNRYPRCMALSMWLGLLIYTASTLAASFTKSMNWLIVFRGIGPGIAATLCAFPIIRWLPEWFDRRQGIATGIVFSGGGVGGVFMPILFQYLIDKVGYQWTLRISAISTGAVAGLAIPFIRPRVKISTTAPIRPVPMPPFFATFSHSGFYSCFLSTLLQAFGYFNVGLFLPRFTDTLGNTAGSGLLSAFNVSVIGAQILWGYLTDRMNPTIAMAISLSLGCVLTLTLWGAGGAIGIVLAPFAMSFGLATGGFTYVWSQTAHTIAGPNEEQQTLLFAGFSIARGLGAAIGPTAGAELYRTPERPSSNRWGSAGSPGLVALVASSLVSSVSAGLIFVDLPGFIKRVRNGESSADDGTPERIGIAPRVNGSGAAGDQGTMERT